MLTFTAHGPRDACELHRNRRLHFGEHSCAALAARQAVHAEFLDERSSQTIYRPRGDAYALAAAPLLRLWFPQRRAMACEQGQWTAQGPSEWARTEVAAVAAEHCMRRSK